MNDAYYEKPCTPCADEGLNAEGQFYCKRCNKDFCVMCKQYHKRFFKTHSVAENKPKALKGGYEETYVLMEGSEEMDNEDEVEQTSDSCPRERCVDGLTLV